MQTRDGLALVTGSALRGSAYLLTRVAVPAFGPFALIDARMGIAVVLLLVWAVARGSVPPFWRRWREYLTLGAISVAVPYTLLAWALLTVPSGFAAIVLATLPLFTALLATIRLHERPSARQVLGLVVGFTGVAVLVGFEPLVTSPAFLIAVGALLLSAVLWSWGTIYAASHFAGTPVLETTIGQLMGASVLLLPLALVTLPPTRPPPYAIAAMLALAVLVTAVASLIHIRLIFAWGATRSMTGAYLDPLFATVCGVLVLNEQIGGATILGMAAILAGVTLVNTTRFALPWRRSVSRPTSAA